MFDATALLSDTIRKPAPGRNAASRPSAAQTDFDKLLKQPKADDARRPAPASRLEGKDVPQQSQSRHNEERRAEPRRKDDTRPAQGEARKADKPDQKRAEAAKPEQTEKDTAPATAVATTETTTDAAADTTTVKTSDQGKPVETPVATPSTVEPTVATTQLAGQVLSLAQASADAEALAAPTAAEGVLTAAQAEAVTLLNGIGAGDETTEALAGEAAAPATSTETAPIAVQAAAVVQTISTTPETEAKDADQAAAIGTGASKSTLPQQAQIADGKGAEMTPADTQAAAKTASEPAIAVAAQDTSSKPPATTKETPRVAEVQPSASPASSIAAAQAQPTIGEAAANKTAQAATVPDRADAPVPLHAMAVEVGMRAMRGAREFSIRLDPENLGRVDIQLEISEAGEVQAKLVVERVETLALLQRDAKTLERAFDQAGLKSNPDGLQFSLRDPGQQGQQRQEQDQPRNGRPAIDLGPDRSAETDILTRRLQLARREVGGVDISI